MLSMLLPHPTYTRQEKSDWAKYLTGLLAARSANYCTVSRPTLASVVLYEGTVAYRVHIGTWEISTSTNPRMIYMGHMGQEQRVELLTRLQIIGAISNCVGICDKLFTDTLLEEYLYIVGQSVTLLYRGLVTSQQMPTMLAFSHDFTRQAVYMDNNWYSAGGEQVEVDNTWTILQL